MSGYIPLFGSLTTGTLCGRWPDVGLWPIVLSLSDRHGIVDVTHAYIATVTGLSIDDVRACMQRFCEPDPGSRTPDENGARLELIDRHRDWGWRIINHAKYREKARLRAKDAERTASGRDAERKRASRTGAKTATTATPEFHRQIIDAYHDALPELPRVKDWSESRRKALDARIAERKSKGAETIGYWRAYFEKVAASDFLTGRATDFRANLEWLVQRKNFTKVIEGNFDNTKGGGQ